MFINRFFEDIRLNNNDKIYLILLLIFSILITYILISFHQLRGAFNSDIFRYLPAALNFAGLNYNHISDPSWMYNSPVIFYLTSILFRLGFVHINSIFIVTGIFGIIGIFGMYTFLKIRFSPLLSFTGAILYNSFSLTLFYFANGMLDTSAVAMMLWTFVFLVAAVDKNPKYYPLMSISFVISIFIRFTNVYIISLIVLYILKNHDIINLIECLFKNKLKFKQQILNFIKSSEFKWILFSICLVVILISYVFYVLLSFGSEIGYFRMASSSLSNFHSPSDYNFITDKFFYLKNFLSLMFSNKITSIGMIEQFNSPSLMAYLICFILISGILLKIINIYKNKNLFKLNKKLIEFRTKNSERLLLIFSGLLFILSILSLHYSYLACLFFLWFVFIIILSLLKSYPINHENSALSLLCLALFSFYLIIFSLMDLKCVRYILPVFPAVVYFVICALNEIVILIDNLLKNYESSLINHGKLKFKNNLSKILPISLVILLLFTAFNFTNTVEIDNIGLEIDDVSNYLINYDHDYQSKTIATKSGEMFYEWYFQKRIDLIDVNNLNGIHYDYIITWPELNNAHYHEIYHSGGTFLYEHNN